MSEETVQVPGSLLHYAAYKAIGWLASVLPIETQYTIARMAANAYFNLDRCARESVCANQEAILGLEAAPFAIRQEARRVFHSFGRYLVEFFGYERFSGTYIDRNVLIQGREHVDAGLKAGKGVLFVSGHYSNWELGPMTVAQMGYPMLAIVQMHAHPKVNALFVEQRARRGVEIVHSGDAALRAMKALKRNRTVAMLGDRPTGGPTIEVEWFGRKTFLPQGPWRIALTTGAALLPTFMARRAENNYILEIGAPIIIPMYNDAAKSVAELAQSWARRWEARVKRDPSQWEVFYPIWK